MADTLDRYNQYTGDPGFLPKDVAMVQAVNTASVKAAAAKYLTKDSAVVVYTVPGKKELNDVPRSPADTDAKVAITNPYTPEFEKSQDWRKTPPEPGPAPQLHLPIPQTFTLANGMKGYVVENHALPILSASVVTRAGSEGNPKGKGGLATLVSDVMSDGTQSRDLTKLAEDQELVGTRINSSASMDSSGSSMTVLTEFTDPGMELLSDVVLHPAFRQEDLDRRKKQRLVRIGQETDNVAQMAFRVGPKLIYGDQPYGASPTGTTASIKSITHEDVAGFYQSHFAPADSAIVFAGDINVAQAKALSEKYFGAWQANAGAAPTIPPAPTAQATRVVVIDKPGAPQTALFAFGLGLPANSPDLPTIQVANYTLGGAFTSRINMNLREAHGYTYGAQSGYQTYRAGGQFLAGGLVRTDVTAPAAKELMTEVRNFPSHPPTDAELSAAKSALTQSLQGNFETNGVSAGAMASIFLYDRPLDYYATLPAKYSAVTSADVARVASEDIHPGNLVIIAAGDRSKIEPGLKEAGLGTVEVRNIDGEVVK